MALSDSELSRLLKNARDQLAPKLGMNKGDLDSQWAEDLNYGKDTVRNWLRGTNPSRPPYKVIFYIIKECLKAGVMDRSTARRLMKELPETLRAELQTLLPSGTSQDRIMIFNISSDQPLANLIASRLSADFHISFDAHRSPERFSDELQKAVGAIGLHTGAAAQDELFNHWLDDVRLRKQSGQLLFAVLVHEGLNAAVELYRNEGFQTAYWPRTQDQQQPALERLRRILRGDTVPEESVSDLVESTAVPWEREDLGAVPIDSHFYIERATDRRALRTADQPSGGHVLIKGPRQVGKTSLLLRVAEAGRRKGKRVVELNLQTLRSEMDDLDDLLYALCSEIQRKLNLENQLSASWEKFKDWAPVPRCQAYLMENVLKTDLPVVLLALDEVDAVFDKNFRTDFFGMLRAWINEGRLRTDTGKRMNQLELALVTSTEPRWFITDSQSPFNVLEPIVLQDFTLEQTSELNQRHHSLLTPSALEQLFAMLNGHIYLTRRALNLIDSGEITFDGLKKTANDSVNGPFSSHLETLWSRLPKEQEILSALKQVLKSGHCEDEKILHRLVGAGLIILTGKDRKPLARCKLYELFLKERLRKYK